MILNTVAWIVRYRLWVLIAISLATLFFATQIRNLQIVINPNTMLPQAHPSVIATNLAESLFGSKHVVVIGISSVDGSTALTPRILTTLRQLSQSISELPGIKGHTLMSVTANKAKSISGSAEEMRVDPMLDSPLDAHAIAQLRERIATNPVYRGTLVSEDESLVSLSFAIQADQGGFRKIMNGVQQAIDQQSSADLRITASGSPVFFAAVERFAQRMAILFPIALLIIGLIHLEAFRTLQGLILPLLTALLAVIWGLGVMGAVGVPMDAFNATTPILILAVAAGHAVQILKRYYEEYDKLTAGVATDAPQQFNNQAIIQSLSRVAPVMLTAGGVAALGFFSLVTFDIATIRTFGLFTGLGILSALFIELTFIPALRSYLPAPAIKKTTIPNAPRVWDRLADRLTTLILKRSGLIVSFFMLIALLASVGLLFLNKENSTKSYFGHQLSVYQDDDFLNRKLAGTNTLYVVFQGEHADSLKDPKTLRVIEDTQRFIETQPDVGKTTSIVDFIKQMSQSMNEGKPQFYRLPDAQDMVSQYLLLYSMSGDPTDFDAYIDYEYRNANLIVWTKNDSSTYAAKLVEAIRGYVQNRLPVGVKVQIGGSVPQSSALSETLVEGKIKNILQMMGVILLAGALIFRSLMGGVYLVLPLAVTVLVNLGVMGAIGIPLNTPNSVASAMAIGIGADYAIYILYRMREELRRVDNFDLALQETMRTAGKAVVYVATAIAGGYSVLMLSFNFYVHIWFGFLIVLSMIVSALCALVLIPSLIKAFSPTFMRAQSMKNPLPTTALMGMFAMVMGLTVLPDTAQAQTPDAEAIMSRSYQATRMDSSLSQSTFTLTSASGQERVRKTFAATRLQSDGVNNRRVIRFLSPSDVRNTTTLIIEKSEQDDVWVYLPTLKKARRLASSNNNRSFVGTDLSYGDLIGHKPQDWTHRLLREESIDGVTAYVIESLPKTAEIARNTGYSKRISWVANDSFVAVKAQLYDASQALQKTAISRELKLVDTARKKYQPMLVEVSNHQTGHSTTVRMDGFEANIDVRDSYFTNGYLEREE